MSSSSICENLRILASGVKIKTNVGSSNAERVNNPDPIISIFNSPCLVIVQCINKCIFRVNENLTYNIRIINRSSIDITDLCLIDILPKNTKLVFCNASSGYSAYLRDKLFFKFYKIKALSAQEITITVLATKTGMIENCIYIKSQQHNRISINNPSKQMNIIVS
ncbi:DUF11 domain-containing protein [Clostridium oryzae]|uniref:DUF11 domain-containing protein n=1 Tax=Clostridium oryzae TaxID=1450648 RepID=A0A1V4IKF6_9CLOT|nr:DUF11 domain-containing protein [Clostridium oryzae]OPJ60320.1 hypothetical protein CLORY_28950 [Clostridium oryzae]